MGPRSFERNLGSLFDDLKVNAVGEDVLTLVCDVDAPVIQLTIQPDFAPFLIVQYSNDAEDAPSKIS